MSRLSFLFLGLFLVVGLHLPAQTPDTATIHGQVVDQSRAPVSGVHISARNAQTGSERTAQSDNSGNFSMAGLSVAGDYDIIASKDGFAEANLKAVTLAGG